MGLTKGEKEVDNEDGRLDGRLPKVLHVGSLAMSEICYPLSLQMSRDKLQYHILTKLQPTRPKLFRENFARQVIVEICLTADLPAISEIFKILAGIFKIKMDSDFSRMLNIQSPFFRFISNLTNENVLLHACLNLGLYCRTKQKFLGSNFLFHLF